MNCEYLVARFERKGSISHENTTTRLGQRAIRYQAGDDVLGACDSLGAHLDPLLGIDPGNDTGLPIDFAVDPNLPVVVHVCFKKHPAVGQRHAINLSGYFQSDAIPGEGETNGETLANVSTNLPPRVVIVR